MTNLVTYRWKGKTGQYQTGEWLFVGGKGGVCIGGYEWNGSMSGDNTDEYKKAHRYIGRISLPLLKEAAYYGDSPETVKTKMESAADSWFKAVLNV